MQRNDISTYIREKKSRLIDGTDRLVNPVKLGKPIGYFGFTQKRYDAAGRPGLPIQISVPDTSGERVIAGQRSDGLSNVDGFGTNAKFHDMHAVYSINSDTLLIVDRIYHFIRKYIISTTYVSTFAGQYSISGSSNATLLTSTFNYPNSLAYDSVNSILYVADGTSIRKIDINANAVTKLLDIPVGYDIFSSIVYRNGFLFGVDAQKSIIFKVDVSNGTITILAGSTSGGTGYVDGTGSSVRFDADSGGQLITTDNSGHLYIADYGNNCIRKLNIITNEVTTIKILINPISIIQFNSLNNLFYYNQLNSIYTFDPITGNTNKLFSTESIKSFIMINPTLFYIASSYKQLLRVQL